MDADKLEQLKVVSEYVKFHIGMYLATPPVLIIIAEGIGVQTTTPWLWGLCLMIIAFLLSGMSAAWFMGRYINVPWTPELLDKFTDEAYTFWRRFKHHWLYWIGLLIGLGSLIIAYLEKSRVGG